MGGMFKWRYECILDVGGPTRNPVLADTRHLSMIAAISDGIAAPGERLSITVPDYHWPMSSAPEVASLPRALSSYPDQSGLSLYQLLLDRIHIEPFNAIATAIFALAIIHTFGANQFTKRAHHMQHRHAKRARLAGRPQTPSVSAEVLHFMGEIEVVFGLWSIVLLIAMVTYANWDTATHYFNDGVNYTEPLFVVVIMALAATRPIIAFAEAAMRRIANVGRCTPAAWWLTILTVGPLLGSFITEPAAMTICALLLARQFYDLEPSTRLKYATLGLLFVNVSIGGTLTPFAAPPILMVARTWEWGFGFVIGHFGWRAVAAILISNVVYLLLFKRELTDLAGKAAAPDRFEPETPGDEPLPLSPWITVASCRLHGMDGHDRSLSGTVCWRIPGVSGICQGHLRVPKPN